MARNILETYKTIMQVLGAAHKDGQFSRTEVTNLLLQELDVFREETQAAHIKTMVGLGYIILISSGTAYKDAKYQLGPRGLGEVQ